MNRDDTRHDHGIVTIGWREWLSLPDLGIDRIKAKVDTGARTSALHTFDLEAYRDKGAPMVRFKIHPLQKRKDVVIESVAPVSDYRQVTDSGGHREQRYVIVTTIVLGDYRWEAEMTLTKRDGMRFRMLLGRSAIAGRFAIDPHASYLLGKKPISSKAKKRHG